MNRAGTGRITLAASSLGISAQGPSTQRFAIFFDLKACIGNLRREAGFPLYAFSLSIVCFGIYQSRSELSTCSISQVWLRMICSASASDAYESSLSGKRNV